MFQVGKCTREPPFVFFLSLIWRVSLKTIFWKWLFFFSWLRLVSCLSLQKNVYSRRFSRLEGATGHRHVFVPASAVKRYMMPRTHFEKWYIPVVTAV